MPTNNRPLGKTQRAVLAALRQHKRWPGGWYWDNYSGTVRVLDSLVARGLVERTIEDRQPVYRPKSL